MSKIVLGSLLVLTLATGVVAQGRGRGGGVGGGHGSGGSGGPPPGAGVDRGLGNASGRSGGRSDDGLSNASTRSNGRSDAGLERARRASSNLRHADDDLQDHPNLPRAFRTPWVPWVPLASAGVSFFLMLSLPGATWLRLAIWMAIGLVIYGLYGRKAKSV